MSIILSLFLVVFFGSIVASVVLVKKGHSVMRAFAMQLATFIVSCVCFVGATFAVSAVNERDDDRNVISASINSSVGDDVAIKQEKELQEVTNNRLNAIAAAIAIAGAAIGCGLAIASAAPAAIGAMTEDPKTFGKSMIFVVLGESIIIFGFVVALILKFV